MNKNLILVFLLLSTIDLTSQNYPSPLIDINLSRGTELRVLKLAVSVTVKFTQSVAGTSDRVKVEEVLRQTKAWLEKINIIYGREYCVRFELLSDNE
ncbi:MAG: hypothetical protein ACJA1Z_001108 [Patiriisocius sp.]